LDKQVFWRQILAATDAGALRGGTADVRGVLPCPYR